MELSLTLTNIEILTLKGDPLSVLMSLLKSAIPLAKNMLQIKTGYSDKTVAKAVQHS